MCEGSEDGLRGIDNHAFHVIAADDIVLTRSHGLALVLLPAPIPKIFTSPVLSKVQRHHFNELTLASAGIVEISNQ